MATNEGFVLDINRRLVDALLQGGEGEGGLDSAIKGFNFRTLTDGIEIRINGVDLKPLLLAFQSGEGLEGELFDLGERLLNRSLGGANPFERQVAGFLFDIFRFLVTQGTDGLGDFVSTQLQARIANIIEAYLPNEVRAQVGDLVDPLVESLTLFDQEVTPKVEDRLAPAIKRLEREAPGSAVPLRWQLVTSPEPTLSTVQDGFSHQMINGDWLNFIRPDTEGPIPTDLRIVRDELVRQETAFATISSIVSNSIMDAKVSAAGTWAERASAQIQTISVPTSELTDDEFSQALTEAAIEEALNLAIDQILDIVFPSPEFRTLRQETEREVRRVINDFREDLF